MADNGLLLNLTPPVPPKRTPLLRWTLRGLKYKSLPTKRLILTLYFNETSHNYGLEYEFRHEKKTRRMYSDWAGDDPFRYLEFVVTSSLVSLKRIYGGWVEFENLQKGNQVCGFSLSLATGLTV